MSVWTSAGAESRSVAELGMTNLEQMRLVRSGNTAASMRSKEFDGLHAEADDDFFQEVTKKYQAEAADYAKWAATASAVSALIGAGVSVSSSIKDLAKSSGDVTKIVKASLSVTQSLLGVVGPILNLISTWEEAELLKKQASHFEAKADESAVRAQAIDANPDIGGR